jgi:hypothetical protein
MESSVISFNLPVLPGSSVSFPHLPTINTLPHIPFQICLYNSYISFIPQDVLLLLMHFPVFKSHLPEFHCIFHRSPDLLQDVPVCGPRSSCILKTHIGFSCTLPGSPFISQNLNIYHRILNFSDTVCPKSPK